MNKSEQERVKQPSTCYLQEQLDFDKRLISFCDETIKPKLVGKRGLELGPAVGEMTQFFFKKIGQKK